MRVFIGFAILSGLGWISDFLTFTMLVTWVNTPSFVANIISSYVGVTFVWFTSLKAVFKRTDDGRRLFLMGYWCFQFVSILLYSQLLHLVADAMPATLPRLDGLYDADIAGKIIITPLNLVTNFAFMKSITRFMREESVIHD